MSVRNISRQSCPYYMVTIFAKQQLCLRSHVTLSLELKTYNTWYVFKRLGYKMSNYLVYNLFIYKKIYIYTCTHTHVREIRHEGRLRKDVWEGKGRHCLWPHHRAIFIQVLASCQSCTQNYHPHHIFSLNFLTALIWGDADLTIWVLELPLITEYIKMPQVLCVPRYEFLHL